jgi:hypothetical protein
VIDSGAFEDSKDECHIRFYLGTATLICELPQVIPDQVSRHSAAGSWDAATIARLGRDWYEIHTPCEFGFSVSEGALHLRYGAQTHDSLTDKSKCFFLPWRQWRHVRRSLYDAKGQHFCSEWDWQEALRSTASGEHRHNAWEATRAVEAACPVVRFEFDDYDGERILAKTRIEEREWRFGTGVFRWLSWFRRPKIQRCIEVNYTSEVGPSKGSWKGGLMGHAIELLPGELHEAAFRRYCGQEHRSRHGAYRIKFVRAIDDDPPSHVGQANPAQASQ